MPGGVTQSFGRNPEIRGRLSYMKKSYERPAIVHTEKLEARAVVCNKGDDTACGGQIIQS